MSYIPEYHENYYRVEGTAYNQGKIGIGTVNPVQLLHVSGGNIRVDGSGYINGDLNVSGNLNVYGTSAQFAVSQIIAEDKSIELNVATGSPIGGGSYTPVAFSDDAGAENGGITLKSTQGDKEIIYKTSSPASGWVSNLRWIVSGNYGKNTLQLSDTNSDVGLTIGTDANNVNLYRSANNTLKTDDNLIVNLNLNVNGNTTLGDANTDATIIRGITKIADSSATNGILLGTNDASYDTNIYRSAADTLKTDDSLVVDTNLTVNGASTLGSDSADTISFNGRANTNLEPSTNNSRNIGSSTLNWASIFANDILVKNNLNVTGALSVGTNTTLTGNLNVNGNTTLGDSYSNDTILITGRLTQGITQISGTQIATPVQTSAVNVGSDLVIVTGISNPGTFGIIGLPSWVYGSSIEIRNRAGATIGVYPSGTSQIFTTTGTPPLLGAGVYTTINNNSNTTFHAGFSGSTQIWWA